LVRKSLFQDHNCKRPKKKGWPKRRDSQRERLAKEKDLPKRKASRKQCESKGWPKRKDGQKEGMAEAGTPKKWSENGLWAVSHGKGPKLGPLRNH
jgi:hypothetical protein